MARERGGEGLFIRDQENCEPGDKNCGILEKFFIVFFSSKKCVPTIGVLIFVMLFSSLRTLFGNNYYQHIVCSRVVEHSISIGFF